MIDCLNWKPYVTQDGSLYFENTITKKHMTIGEYESLFKNHSEVYDIYENKITCKICGSQSLENVKN